MAINHIQYIVLSGLIKSINCILKKTKSKEYLKIYFYWPIITDIYNMLYVDYGLYEIKAKVTAIKKIAMSLKTISKLDRLNITIKNIVKAEITEA